MSSIEKQKIPAYALIVVSVVSYLIMLMTSNGLLGESGYGSEYTSAYDIASEVIPWLLMYVFPVTCVMYAISLYISGPSTDRGTPRALRIFVMVLSCLIALIPIWYTIASLIPYEPEPGLHFGPQFAAVVVAYLSAWVSIPVVALSVAYLTFGTPGRKR